MAFNQSTTDLNIHMRQNTSPNSWYSLQLCTLSCLFYIWVLQMLLPKLSLLYFLFSPNKFQKIFMIYLPIFSDSVPLWWLLAGLVKVNNIFATHMWQVHSVGNALLRNKAAAYIGMTFNAEMVEQFCFITHDNCFHIVFYINHCFCHFLWIAWNDFTFVTLI